MGVFEDLKARGLIAQLTNEDSIRELMNSGGATFYIGYDATADSLHVGHYLQLVTSARLQQAGNKPIVLLGGGTTMVGDPSGRNDMRKIMTREMINHNAECFKSPDGQVHRL
jgi:tyrosyl-tRNA synthetase